MVSPQKPPSSVASARAEAKDEELLETENCRAPYAPKATADGKYCFGERKGGEMKKGLKTCCFFFLFLTFDWGAFCSFCHILGGFMVFVGVRVWRWVGSEWKGRGVGRDTTDATCEFLWMFHWKCEGLAAKAMNWLYFVTYTVLEHAVKSPVLAKNPRFSKDFSHPNIQRDAPQNVMQRAVSHDPNGARGSEASLGTAILERHRVLQVCLGRETLGLGWMG